MMNMWRSPKSKPKNQRHEADDDPGIAPASESQEDPHVPNGSDGSNGAPEDVPHPAERQLAVVQQQLSDAQAEMAEMAEKIRELQPYADKYNRLQLKYEEQSKEIELLETRLREQGGQVQKQGREMDDRFKGLQEQVAALQKAMKETATTAWCNELQRQVVELGDSLVVDGNVRDMAAGWEQKLDAAVGQLNKDIERVEKRQQTLGGATAMLVEATEEKPARKARAHNVVVSIGHYLAINNLQTQADQDTDDARGTGRPVGGRGGERGQGRAGGGGQGQGRGGGGQGQGRGAGGQGGRGGTGTWGGRRGGSATSLLDVESIVQDFIKAVNQAGRINVRRTDISRAVPLGNHPLMLITFTNTTMRDAVLTAWYKILHNDVNKFGVREDLTKGQMRQMTYMKPLYKHLHRGAAGRESGAPRGPFFKRGFLYYHKPGSNEPLLHPANYNPNKVPTALQGEMSALRAQLWPGCTLRVTPGAAGQQQQP